MFNFGMQDVKLFGIVCFGLFALLMFFVPINQWWFVWDYVETTPLWLVMGQTWPFLIVAIVATIFLILFRELVMK